MMDWLRQSFQRLLALFRGAQLDRELDAEMSAHVQFAMEENLQNGMSPTEARRQAFLRFGGPQQAKEQHREARGFPALDALVQDLRFGLRVLRKNVGFTTVALLALALGIGGTSAMFSIVYATLLAPLPYPNPNQLVMVWSTHNGDQHQVVSTQDFLDWRQQNTVFQGMAAWTGASFNLQGTGHPMHIDGGRYTPGFLDKVVGERPYLGRYFLLEEAEQGKDHVTVLNYTLWKNTFGGDPSIIGRQIRLNGELYTVVGVRPPGYPDSGGDHGNTLCVPLLFKPEELNREGHWLMVMGRLRPGVSVSAGNAEMELIARHLTQAYPKTNDKWSARVEPLKNDFFPRESRMALWLLLGAAGFVLLIACANVANLLLAWGTSRQKEIAVRASVGAARGRIFRQFLLESLMLGMLGGTLGVALGEAMLKGVMWLLPVGMLPTEANPQMNLPVLLFAMAASMLCGVLFGCFPAWQASRQGVNEMLKDGGRSSDGSGRRSFLRRGLVVVEFTLALVLVAGAGLIIHSFLNVSRVDLGIRSDHVLTFIVPVQEGRLTEPDQVRRFYEQVLEKIRAVPGVSRAAACFGIPVSGRRAQLPFAVRGQVFGDLVSMPRTTFDAVTPDYFNTYGIRVVQGRSFTAQDVAGGVRVAMVNESFAKKYLAGLDPLTQRITIPELLMHPPFLGSPAEWQIVGVFHDVMFASRGRNEQDEPEVDVPFDQSPWPYVSIALRTHAEPTAVIGGVGAALQEVDADLPMANVRTMDQIVSDAVATDRFAVLVFGGFAGLALLLAAIGIYGVMNFSVAQRKHEMGIRTALGATRLQILQLIVGDGMKAALIGLGLGLPGIYLVGRALSSQLYKVQAIDVSALIPVILALLLAALLGCYIPARRATRVDPMVELRNE